MPLRESAGCSEVSGEHSNNRPTPALQRRRLYSPIACRGRNQAMWFVGGVQIHVLDDDALAVLHGLGARRAFVCPNRAEIVVARTLFSRRFAGRRAALH
jgi:hypothetical protein